MGLVGEKCDITDVCALFTDICDVTLTLKSQTFESQSDDACGVSCLLSLPLAIKSDETSNTWT